jgi:anti-sigma regulatory factor (Ser/Thr protein kinase)
MIPPDARVARDADFPVQLLIRMSPPWVFIDELRRFTESFCACACPGQDREAQVALAVHELMQNAVPHAHGDEVELILEVSREADVVAIRVTNRCSDEDYLALRERIERMNTEPDALAHYVRMMRENPATTRGGLGLARVRFEAQLEISVRREAGRVTVEAVGPLRAPRLPAVGGTHG